MGQSTKYYFLSFQQGYKMDDLLTSYISMMLTNINKGKRGTIHGERL